MGERMGKRNWTESAAGLCWQPHHTKQVSTRERAVAVQGMRSFFFEDRARPAEACAPCCSLLPAPSALRWPSLSLVHPRDDPIPEAGVIRPQLDAHRSNAPGSRSAV